MSSFRSNRHISGLESLADLRGGLAKLGFHGMLETFGNVWKTHHSLKQNLLLAHKDTIAHASRLSYPRHPFEPDLSVRIAKLPAGLRDLIVSRRLSYDMIDLVERVLECRPSSRAHKHNNTPHLPSVSVDGLALRLVDTVNDKAFSTREHLVAIALLSCCCYWGALNVKVPRCWLHIQCASLLRKGVGTSHSENGVHVHDTQLRDLQRWVGLVLASTNLDGSEAVALSKMLLRVSGGCSDEQSVKIRHRFFWDPDFPDRNLVSSGQ